MAPWTCRLGLLLGLLWLGVAPLARAAEGEPEDGDLWLLRRYEVDNCRPVIPPPTVFDWLGRKTIGIDGYLATSADCGLARTMESEDGWTYVYWSAETFAGTVIRRAIEKFNLSELVPLTGDQGWTVVAIGPYEPFVLIQLRGEWPIRVWAHGTAGRLEVEVRPAGEAAFELRARSESPGRECVSDWQPLSVGLQPDDQQRVSLACS